MAASLTVSTYIPATQELFVHSQSSFSGNEFIKTHRKDTGTPSARWSCLLAHNVCDTRLDIHVLTIGLYPPSICYFPFELLMAG